ncbi:uncharacterized protein LOC107773062 [Nicotiana tabacum]|uniref:Uncharacterized protein LOC107773062 n=1 Tax=Nicotiana tabacum TaxID=4097 RepID=A0A1S3Y7M3_TOBAC|nr:PREDICTED: uncharacterized protein LOC107773062 [Nicotiana tabacum]
MEKLFTIEDYELWNIILDGPNISIKLDSKGREVPKERSEFNDIDRNLMEKNSRAKKDTLQIVHKGTSQMKQSRIDMLLRNYELFIMKYSKPIQDMVTRFTVITNELRSLGKSFISGIGKKHPENTSYQKAKLLQSKEKKN